MGARYTPCPFFLRFWGDSGDFLRFHDFFREKRQKNLKKSALCAKELCAERRFSSVSRRIFMKLGGILSQYSERAFCDFHAIRVMQRVFLALRCNSEKFRKNRPKSPGCLFLRCFSTNGRETARKAYLVSLPGFPPFSTVSDHSKVFSDLLVPKTPLSGEPRFERDDHGYL